MTNETNRTEFEQIINKLNCLEGDDAKSLLKIIYGYVSTAMTGNGGDDMKLERLENISNVYKSVPDVTVHKK